MKSFFKQYGYTCVKLLLNQFAISIFGTVLAMATTSAGNDTFTLAVSIFAIIFYLFLTYNVMWEVGAKDRLSFDLGKKDKKLSRGFLIALAANIPNLLIAVVYTVGYPFMSRYEWAGNMCAIMRITVLFLEGMYLGLTSVITIGGVQMSTYWWTYFVITIPAILATFAAYCFGFKNFRFFPAAAEHKPNKTNMKK